MTRLELNQRLKLECSDSGSITTTLSQTGSNGRIVTWIDQAWLEIQTLRRDWDWMRSSRALGSGASFTTVAGTSVYTLGAPGSGTVGIAAASFGRWLPGTFRCNTTSVGTNDETEMADVDYDYWRDVALMGANRNTRTRPDMIAIAPDHSLCLGFVPAAGYTITGDYYIPPSAMTADSDEPTGLPARFHMAIVYLAMASYGSRETAPEVTTRGAVGYDKLIRQLILDRTAAVATAGALA